MIPENDDHARMILAAVVLVTFAAFVFATVFGRSNADNTVIGMGLGYLAANAQQVVGFYFGSSSGSKSKEAQMVKKPEAPEMMQQNVEVKTSGVGP